MRLEKHEVEAAVRGAFATRGKHKGQLLARCPKSNTDAAAAWQALQSAANPYKVGIATVLFFSERQRLIFDAVGLVIDSLHRQGVSIAVLDRDRAALDALGAW